MNLGCVVCDWFGRSHCLRQIGGASARACVVFHENAPKRLKSRKCGLRTRVPIKGTRVPNFGYIDRDHAETPGFGRFDLIFSKFSLVPFFFKNSLCHCFVHCRSMPNTPYVADIKGGLLGILRVRALTATTFLATETSSLLPMTSE